MHAVGRIFGVADRFRKSVEHFVVRHKFVGKFHGDAVDDFELLVKERAHSQFVGRGHEEGFEYDKHYPCVLYLRQQLFEVALELPEVELFAVFELVERIVYAYHQNGGVGL